MALRKGVTSTWEDNVIEITEPSQQAISVTQIRGNGTLPNLVFNNNRFIGNISTPINKVSSINEGCKLTFYKNYLNGSVISGSEFFNSISSDFRITG